VLFFFGIFGPDLTLTLAPDRKRDNESTFDLDKHDIET